ncbi:PadR family transcriptional regulator [Streptococcus mutans]|uniref:PadR family transcriptional regulator n=1 Tax=Streptococcus mutans TaxID=1309 RepID=UPI0002BE19B7|nr:PadR family transcriptional regulator [Streptococcus mutans]EMP57564.1 putative PadR family transcriptional regulator [Streptococcus mutans KK23]
MIKLLVLAILNVKPMSGYDIKLLLEISDTQRWAGVLPGSIYNALRKLEKDSYIEIESIEASGNRQKAIYKITDSGKKYQTELVKECLTANKIHYPTQLYTGISFADQLPTQEAIDDLQKNKEQLEIEYDILSKGMDSKKKSMSNRIPELTQIIFEHMFETVKSQIELIDKTLTILNRQKEES